MRLGVDAGAPASFSVAASGAALTYQWQKNGASLPGATGSVYSIPSAAVGQAPWEPRTLPMLAHAAVFADGETAWVPTQNRFIELPLSPRTTPATG